MDLGWKSNRLYSTEVNMVEVRLTIGTPSQKGPRKNFETKVHCVVEARNLVNGWTSVRGTSMLGSHLREVIGKCVHEVVLEDLKVKFEETKERLREHNG